MIANYVVQVYNKLIHLFFEEKKKLRAQQNYFKFRNKNKLLVVVSIRMSVFDVVICHLMHKLPILLFVWKCLTNRQDINKYNHLRKTFTQGQCDLDKHNFFFHSIFIFLFITIHTMHGWILYGLVSALIGMSCMLTFLPIFG